MPAARDPQLTIPVVMPYSLLQRVEAIAPTETRARSALIREALTRRLDEIEAKAADPSLKRGATADDR
jgi:metal-responsive CopG/Arc/MetJ family transcriptional regulator